jgi:hypothetical protein
LVLVISVFISGLNCNAQTPSWVWANKATTFGGSMGVRGVKIDVTGNTYTLGSTNAGIRFGNLQTLPGGMFLVKHNAQGNPVWSFQGNCQPAALVTDSAGNSYVTGWFQNTLTLGSQVLICQGKKDIFIAKFDSAGNVLWANRAGGIGRPSAPPTPIALVLEDEGYSIGLDAAGNCYIGAAVVASDTSAAYFGAVAVFPPTSSLFPRQFNVLAKYNSGGQVQWVKKVSNNNLPSLGYRLAVNRQGACVLYGSFSNTINIGSFTLTNKGGTDIGLAKYDTNGNVTWAKSFGGVETENGDAVAIDKQGNVLITGSFQDTVRMGSFTLIKPGSSTGGASFFIAKLDNGGNVQWASQTTGSGSAGDSQMGLDSAGNSFVSAYFAGTVQVGQQSFTSTNGNGDALVSKWNKFGLPVWAISAQGNGLDTPGGIAVNTAGSACYVAGRFEFDLNFGSTTLQTGQNSNFFLAKLENLVLGMAEPLTSESKCVVFPNPATRSFTVKLKDGATGKKAKFLLYNSTGQLVRETEFADEEKLEIDRQNLPAGLYRYSIQLSKESVSGKIILH